MKTGVELDEHIDQLADDELRRSVINVISWTTYPSRVETGARRREGYEWLERLDSADAEAWYPHAREWLKACCRYWPAEASAGFFGQTMEVRDGNRIKDT